jgi:drug/metabolite transporter superfamily protein YnfA
VAIVGIWIAWRWRTRSWSWHLLVAAAISLVIFLAVMPSFLVHSDAVFVGEG